MKCRVCKASTEQVLDLGDQMLSDFRDDDVLPPAFPLHLVFCDECKLVQLDNTVDPNLMYNDNYGFKSGINGTIKADLEDIVEQALYVRKDPKSVLDIGCNDGTLLSFYDANVRRVGFDPVKKFKKESSAHANEIFDTFFSADLLDEQFDIITSISMFYDLDDPNKFVSDIKKILAPRGIWIVQQNYLGAMLRNFAYDNISHEHLEYYSLLSFENLLKTHDLQVVDVWENNINGGSFRTIITHKGVAGYSSRVDLFQERERQEKVNERETYIRFQKKIDKLSQELGSLIWNLSKSGKRVALYGASTRGNVILQASGIDSSMVECAVERNPEKWGKKIASVQIPIISEEEARKKKYDYMLVLPYFFIDEFVKREEEYLKDGKFIVPLPDIRIIC